MKTVIVSGPLANKPLNGGNAWVILSWILGLRRLGFQVIFVEQIGAAACIDGANNRSPFATSINRAYFRDICERFDLTGSAALIADDGEALEGLSRIELLTIAGGAELLVNITGHLTNTQILRGIRRRAYLDLDPGYTQFWANGFRLDGHDVFFTVGENIGKPGCSIPTVGIDWLPVRQPVILDDWPAAPSGSRDRFTTVASWRGGYGKVEHNGKTFGLKANEFRKFVELPSRAPGCFELALEIYPGDDADRQRLEEHGWMLIDPKVVAADPESFRRYVQSSAGEFSAAQGIYVETESGWFSDRTTRYLAAGKPALVQDTGFSRNLPVGEGLIAFRTLDEAVEGAKRISADYERHAAAARDLAGTYFSSDDILARFVADCGL